MSEWSENDERQANVEGWCISNDSDDTSVIQMIDDSDAFENDADALGFVYQRAREGSDLHMRAMTHTLAAPKHNDEADHLRGLPLIEAMWLFIENIDSEHPARTEFFFLLRERYRSEYQMTR